MNRWERSMDFLDLHLPFDYWIKCDMLEINVIKLW